MAYAALLSLMHILDQILHPAHHLLFLNRKQIESLHEKVIFLQDFLEHYPPRKEEEETQDLEGNIAAAAYAAEDIIESHVVDQILAKSAGSGDEISTLFRRDIERVVEEMDSITEEVMRIKEIEGVKDQKPIKSALSRPAPTGKNTMVGFDDDLIRIMDGLTGQQTNLQIISIVGMGGIGKTTLVKNIYDNSFIVQYFHIRAWVTVSQEYSVREILLGLLHQIGVHTDHSIQEGYENLAAFNERMSVKSDDLLGEQLHKRLSGLRYIIVMDDIWSTEAWDDIKMFFPDNSSGSRIMVTTRLSNVAVHFRSCSPYKLDFLDEDKSWTLFCNKVFGLEDCPSEMEAIGKKIVKNCRGLPLAIVTISGLLAKSDMTVEHWEYIAQDMNSIVNSGDDGFCIKTLSLSYNHLPINLKLCFLYMGIFPEDYEIHISRLIKLWVGEGIIKPISGRTLEEVAEDCLKDLVDRNLVLVRKYGSCGKMSTCSIHDLLRDLCLKEAQKDKLFHVTRIHSLDNIPSSIQSERRLIIRQRTKEVKHHRQVFNALTPASRVRSLICDDFKFPSPKLPFSFRLLRLLDTVGSYSYEETLQLVNSRYLGFREPILANHLDPLKSLPLLWNLQTIIVSGSFRETPIYLPSEIWEMPQLRHLKIEEVCIPDPPNSKILTERNHSFVLENLQTLVKIRNFKFTKEVLHRIPNVKKLGLHYKDFARGVGSSYYCVQNLVHLSSLDELFLKCDKYVLQNLTFPHSLKKLSLSHCGLPWENLTMVGSLPNLVVLKLNYYAVRGPEWNPVEGEFLRLKFLLIETNDLMYWNADNSHFPSLETLVLSYVQLLEEIPSGIGDIQTLRLIRLFCCSDSAVTSAKQIQEDQECLGNEDLQVQVHARGRQELQFWESHFRKFKFTLG